MHILQTISHYIPAYRYGGALHVAHSLSKSLAACGNEVHVCTTNLQDWQHDLDVPLDTPVDMEGVRVFYEPVRLSRYWGFSPAMVRRVWQEAAWADVLLLHFHYQFASAVGGWISRARNKPYIIFAHGSLNRYAVSGRSATRKWLYLHLLENENFRRALFTAYHSQEEMDNSLRFGRGRVVSNGIDPQAFTPLPPRGSFRDRYPALRHRIVYLYLGRLDAGKGLDLLLPAFGKLSDRYPEAHLVVAGGDERGYEAVVRQVVSDLKLSDQVTLTGLLGSPDKLGALQDADVYVLPSRSEGLSIAMLEAMYMGLPVIVTDRVGLWRTIQDHQCGLVVPLDSDRLADALLEMAANKNRGRMGQRGRQLVQEGYVWDVIACDLLARIRELVP